MQISVLFFAKCRELIKSSREYLEVPNSISGADLRAFLISTYPKSVDKPCLINCFAEICNWKIGKNIEYYYSTLKTIRYGEIWPLCVIVLIVPWKTSPT